MKVSPRPFLPLVLAAAACAPVEEGPATRTSALTADQCMYYQDGGKVTICHATGSAKHPYAQIRVATTACVNAHAQHPDDHVAPTGDCGADACLAEASPCDATLPCCDGLACTDGRCVAPEPTCVTEDFTELPACGYIPNGTSVFGDLGTVSAASAELFVVTTGSEDCEYSFGPCSTLNVEGGPKVLMDFRGIVSTTTYAFGRTMESFTIGDAWETVIVPMTVQFYRGGVLVLSDTLDRTNMECVTGSTGTWTPSGGFDRVDITGVDPALTDLQACYR
jgi:hypothetical protein